MKFLSVILATRVCDKGMTEEYTDFTSEAEAFFHHVSDDMETFVRKAPRLFRIDVVNVQHVWLVVYADGTFDRLFFGMAWDFDQRDGIDSLPICDVAKIMREHPEQTRTLVASIEAADARDKFMVEAAAAVAQAKRVVARSAQQYVDAIAELPRGGVWNRFFNN